MTHTGEKPHKCTECDKAFIRRSDLIMYQRTHSGDKPYQSHCDKVFSDKGELNTHLRAQTVEKPYNCSQCDRLSHGGVIL